MAWITTSAPIISALLAFGIWLIKLCDHDRLTAARVARKELEIGEQRRLMAQEIQEIVGECRRRKGRITVEAIERGVGRDGAAALIRQVGVDTERQIDAIKGKRSFEITRIEREIDELRAGGVPLPMVN